MRKKRGYWTIESVFEESRKYTSRNEFSKNCRRAYDLALKNGWLDEMTWLGESKTGKKWIKERVFEESRKYTSRSEFSKNCSRAYELSCKNKWLDEMTWLYNDKIKTYHSTKINVIYVYKFIEQNSIYVGLTCNPDRRDKQHRGIEYRKLDSSVYKFAKENNIDIPSMEIIESGLTKLECQELEGVYVDKFKKEGWNILNKSKCGKGCGSLGAMPIKWTKERVFEESKKYTSRTEFQKNCKRAYKVALKNGWLDEMIWLIPQKKHPDGYWTKERVFEESRKYTSRGEFYKNCCSSAYRVALKNGWLDEMIWLNRWTKESVFEESRKYTSRTKFQKKCSSAYNVAYKNGWLDEMTWLQRPKDHNKKWTKERVFEESKKYTSRSEFQKKCSGAYNVAYKNGWLDEIFPK